MLAINKRNKGWLIFMLNGCDYCEEEQVYFLQKYRHPTIVSKNLNINKFCRDCYQKYFEDKICNLFMSNKVISLSDNNKILLSLSGGIDSCVMLVSLYNLIKTGKLKFSFDAITINPEIGNYSEINLARAKKITEEYKIMHKIINFSDYYGYSSKDIILKANHKYKNNAYVGCVYCSGLSSKILNTYAIENDYNIMLYGNHLSDCVNRIFSCLATGNLHTLSLYLTPTTSSHENQFHRVAPLYYFLKNEILAYANLLGLKDFNEKCQFHNEYWRRDLDNFIFFLEDKNPGIQYAIYQIFTNNFSNKINELDLQGKTCDDCGSVIYDANVLLCPSCKYAKDLKLLRPYIKGEIQPCLQ